MRNQTDINQVQFVFRSSIFYCNIIISGIFGVMSFYLICALSFYTARVEKKQKQKYLQLTVENKLAILSKLTCIVIGVASFIRNVSVFVSLIIEYDAIHKNHSGHLRPKLDYMTPVCDVFSVLKNASISIGGSFVYLFLWLRQRVFFIHPSLQTLNNKLVQCFSKGILIVWLLYFIAIGVSYFVGIKYRFNTKLGCLPKKKSLVQFRFFLISWAVAAVIMQIILLVLFLFPIVKRISGWNHRNNPNHHNYGLLRRVKKAVILTSISLVSDVLLSFIVTTFFYAENSNNAIFLVSLNLVINHLVTIVCFDNWKKLLWPWNSKSSENVSVKRKKSEMTSSNFLTINRNLSYQTREFVNRQVTRQKTI